MCLCVRVKVYNPPSPPPPSPSHTLENRNRALCLPQDVSELSKPRDLPLFSPSRALYDYCLEDAHLATGFSLKASRLVTLSESCHEMCVFINHFRTRSWDLERGIALMCCFIYIW